MTNARWCVIPARALGDKRLCRNDVMVLNALGLYGDTDGWCFPSHATIAEKIGAHIVSVRKSIRSLAAYGYLEIWHQYRKDGGQTANEYRIICDVPRNAHKVESQKKTKGRDQLDISPSERHVPPERNGSSPCNEPATAPELGRLTPYNIDTLTSHLSNKINISPKVRKQISYPAEFEQFWTTWPQARRCEKPHAYAAWWLACKKITPDELLAAARRYLLTKEAVDGFAPYPAKWLKRERWLEFEHVPETAKAMLTIADLGADTPENRGFLSVLQKLRDAHGEAVSRSWFNQLRIGNKNCSVLTLHAPSRFVAEWVKSNFADDIAYVVASVWPEITDIRIEHRGQQHGDL